MKTNKSLKKLKCCSKKNKNEKSRGIDVENDSSVLPKAQDEKKNESKVEIKQEHAQEEGKNQSLSDFKPKEKKVDDRPQLNDICQSSSVYFSCRDDFEQFDEDTQIGLLALERSGIFDQKVLEEAIKESLCMPRLVEEDDDIDEMDYAPATVPESKKSKKISFDVPETLLFEGDGTEDTKEEPVARKQSFDIRSTMIIKKALEAPTVKLTCPGYPGQLSPMELKACMELRKILIQESNKDMKEIVLALDGIETDEYALCRLLRSKKFVVKDVISHLEEAVEIWREGRAANFYPSAYDALGADPSIVLALFPYMYSGFGKNGCPVLYFKGGQTNLDGLECIMNVNDIEKFAWHMSMFMFKDIVGKSIEKNGIVRTEQIVIIDLLNLSSKSISASAELLKMFTKVGKCFPELMNRTIIINAPTFFSFAWKMLKSFLDERTKSKIALYSNAKKGTEKLKELIDVDQLLSDYGGSASTFEEVMQSNGMNGDGGYKRQIVQMMNKDKKNLELTLNDKECCEVTVHTKSSLGALFTISNTKTSVQVEKPASLSTDESYNVVIAKSLKGPNSHTITVKSKNWDNFLVVVRVR